MRYALLGLLIGPFGPLDCGGHREDRCVDTCFYALDGMCDQEGGDGLVLCAVGTDCSDCGSTPPVDSDVRETDFVDTSR
jgi:hypothetical protein